MSLVGRGEIVDCGNPKLQIFITLNGVRTNPADLEFAIFDLADPANPAQTFPATGFQPVDPANDCPLGQRLETGRFTALWTVPLDEPLTQHKITWRFRAQQGQPQQEFESPFNVVSAAGSAESPDVQAFRARFPDFSDPVQYPPELVSEVLSEAAECVDSECFGLKTDRARRYYAAHLLSYVTGGARAQGATSVRAGPAGKTWDAAKIRFEATSYGQRYIFLARSACGSGRVLCRSGVLT